MSFSFAQSKSFKISGTLISEEDKMSLESATVYLERVKDSSLVTYTISNKDGDFILEDKTSDKSLNLYISYVGFQTYKKNILIDKGIINLKDISLKIDTNTLDEVLITSRAPITIKKDTLEFNVKSFKTKKDANVEDVLKELPGVEVAEDGSIKVNGKNVSKVLVNGKPFFGNDATITTRNLSKDIIEKIQVTDTKTKAEAFVGEEGDKENKTINLTIKKENNKGVFGRVASGGGTEGTYEYAGMFNYFDNDRRISTLAGGNNINSPGFSFGEIRKMFGGGNSIGFNSNGSFNIDGRSFGGGEGITTSRNEGINYADKYGEKLDVSGSYFHSNSDSENITTTNRENILSDSRFFTNLNSTSINENDSHSANLGFEIKLDSTLLINVKPSVSFSNNKRNFERDQKSNDETGTLINESNSTSFVESTVKDFNNKFDVTKKLGAKGAFFKLQIDNQINNSETNDILTSELNIIGATNNESRNQVTDEENKLNITNLNVTHRIPLIEKKLSLDLKYNYRIESRDNIRNTFDLDNNSTLVLDLSTDFSYTHIKNVPMLNLAYRGNKLSANFEVGYVFRGLENEDGLKPDLSFKRNFESVDIRSSFSYRFSPRKSIQLSHGVVNRAPNYINLQPFQNVSNPLNIITGNPELEPSRNHRIYFSYNSYNFQKRNGFYAYINSEIDENETVAKTSVDNNLVRTTTYENVNGNYNVRTNAFYNRQIKLDSLNLKTLRVNVGIGTSINNNVNFYNTVKYVSRVRSLSPSLGLNFNWKNVMEFRPRYSLSFTKNTYDLNTFKDEEFIFHRLNLGTTTYLPKKLEWRNDIVFSYNPNIAEGFQKSAWFWNSTLAYSVLKDKGTITLKAYDLLNQNTNARRIATANYIQDSQSTVLRKYFMLSFSWKFNSLGKKGEVREFGRRL